MTDDALDSSDTAARRGVQEALAGDIPDESWVQATPGVGADGVGMREAHRVYSQQNTGEATRRRNG